MGKIVLLDDLTINQIAAGEVIERPASAIKEMVENSIDAGAKNITVEIKNGGRTLIRITDDGSGLPEDDMELAFERHATSKIRKADDLQTVTTMGFRGEALASIASIAKVEMISKTENDEIGHRILLEGGKVLEKTEVAAQKGTRITVQNLFYNTPVRYKFLGKDYTEAGHIETVVTRIALINKNVAIKLISNDKVLLQTNGSGDSKNIIYSIYGKDVANGITDVEYTYEDMKVTGVVGSPEIARSNKSNQMFFVNGRYVRDKNLTAATEQAYKDLIPSGKYAFVILNLEMDPSKVDVNVHPAKLEVRFAEEGNVFKAIYHAIKAGLSNEVISSSINNNMNQYENQTTFENTVPAETQNVSEKLNDEEKITTDNFVEEKKAKGGFAGFFRKIIKEPDETAEELENNKVLDIYNARKVTNPEPLTKPIDIFENKAIENNEKVEKIEKTETEEIKESNSTIANEEIIDKTVKLGETAISSNTKELDFNIVEALKEKTQTLDTIKKIEIQETQVIPVTKPQPVAQETQKLDFKEELKTLTDTENIGAQKIEDDVQEVVTKPEEKEEKVETQVEHGQEVVEEKEITTLKENSEKLESTVPSLEAVENITARILEMKMNNLDSTQMIDTNKVRDALSNSEPITPEFANMYKQAFGTEANAIRKEKEFEEKQKEEEREKINISNDFVNAQNDTLFENSDVMPERINYKLIGVAFDTCIIIELKNEMYIIDQNAAAERLMYEKVKNIYYNDESKDSQTLLLPDIITASFREMSLARENVELFAKAGFVYEEFGENTLKLIAVPSICEELNTKRLFLDILNEMDRALLNDTKQKEEIFIKAVAAKSTVKIHRRLDEKEIDELLQRLLNLPEPFDCKHGTATAVKMSKTDIEKKFSRRK